jgi:DNA-binding transcriptional LysR family regulator
MTNLAPHKCRIADMTPNPDDLLVLLAVSRTGRFSSAAAALGVNHTTVSRRIAALELALGGRVLVRSVGAWELTELGSRAILIAQQVEAALAQLEARSNPDQQFSGVVRLSATDGFSAYIAAPAVVELQRSHPRLSVEIITVTRRVMQYRSGLDIEIVVGEPQVHRASAFKLGDYVLGMYASREYLATHGTPTSVAELTRHPLVYFVDSMLLVDALDAPRRLVPQMRDSLSSTNVFVHVEATRSGAGIGFLPAFMANRHEDLVRLLPADFNELLPYWMVLRPDALLQPGIAAVADALRRQTQRRKAELLGEMPPSEGA